MDTIQCTKCSRHMAPRLWHYQNGFGRDRYTQHICPFCGHIQYETGGQMRPWAKALAWLLALPIVVHILLSVLGLLPG